MLRWPGCWKLDSLELQSLSLRPLLLCQVCASNVIIRFRVYVFCKLMLLFASGIMVCFSPKVFTITGSLFYPPGTPGTGLACF